LGELISRHPIDLAFVGIGENGHLAFNDPPADFETTEPYLVVNLDEACRRQQMGEGWFKTLEDVPSQAISMSVLHILKSNVVVATVPDARKAEAVKQSLEGPITPMMPSSILQRHDRVEVFLDHASASLLRHPQAAP
jgi:glucosamine-6-phosphate deaminase